MLLVQYQHPLHGLQEISCHTLVKTEEGLHAKNIHGATFQLLDETHVMSVSTKEETKYLSRQEKMNVQELKDDIAREMNALPEDGVSLEHGGWCSKKEEYERLANLHHEICYFMRQYG